MWYLRPIILKLRRQKQVCHKLEDLLAKASKEQRGEGKKTTSKIEKSSSQSYNKRQVFTWLSQGNTVKERAKMAFLTIT